MAKPNMIKLARFTKGLTQAELAEELEVTTATIQNWEKERSVPTIKDANRLADFLELDKGKVLEFFGKVE